MNCIQKARLNLMVKNMYDMRTRIALIEENIIKDTYELDKLKIRLKMKEEQIKAYRKEIA